MLVRKKTECKHHLCTIKSHEATLTLRLFLKEKIGGKRLYTVYKLNLIYASSLQLCDHYIQKSTVF